MNNQTIFSLYHPNIRKYSSCRNIQYIFQVIKKLCSIFQSCFCIDFTFAVKTVCVCHYLLPVTLCFVQLLYKCIFKSCKRIHPLQRTGSLRRRPHCGKHGHPATVTEPFRCGIAVQPDHLQQIPGGHGDAFHQTGA